MKHILKKYWPIVFAVAAIVIIPTGVAAASVISNKPGLTTVQMYDTATHKSVSIPAAEINKLRSETGPPRTFWLSNGVIHSAPSHDTVTYNKSTKTEIDSLSK